MLFHYQENTNCLFFFSFFFLSLCLEELCRITTPRYYQAVITRLLRSERLCVQKKTGCMVLHVFPCGVIGRLTRP